MSTKNRPFDFWKQVDFNGPNGCWLWTGPSHRQGYGRWMFWGHHWLTHRLSFLLSNHIDPGDWHVCHKCDNPPCVNPDHLFLGTREDNMQDMRKKGRNVRGSRVYEAKLTENDVREIRRLYATGNYTTKVLSAQFGVNKAGISRICNYKLWAHVSDHEISTKFNQKPKGASDESEAS